MSIVSGERQVRYPSTQTDIERALKTTSGRGGREERKGRREGGREREREGGKEGGGESGGEERVGGREIGRVGGREGRRDERGEGGRKEGRWERYNVHVFLFRYFFTPEEINN